MPSLESNSSLVNGIDIANDYGPKALVLMSGGIDSVACAHLLATRNFRVKGVFLDYGQAAAHAERRAVEALTGRMNLPLEIFSVDGASAFSTGELAGRKCFPDIQRDLPDAPAQRDHSNRNTRGYTLL
jgi:tRNA(Ile)-lysidine synthase TilS/MesJ